MLQGLNTFFSGHDGDQHLAAVFRQEERSGLKAAMIGRTIVLLIIGLWLGLSRNYPQNLIIVAGVMTFVCIGLIHLQLLGSRYDYSWVKYLFATIDALMLGLCIAFTDLSVLAPDMLGSNLEAADLKRDLQAWIDQYTNSGAIGNAERSKTPLCESRIEVIEQPGKPGAYSAVAHLRPWLQLEELTTSVRMVTKIPG